MNKIIGLIPVIILASGCASNGEIVAETVAGNLEIRRLEASRYLLDATIPTPLGQMTVRVANPNSTPQVNISDPGAEVVKEIAGLGRDAIKTAGTIYGLREGGNAAIGLVSAAAGAVAEVANNEEKPNVINSYNSDYDSSNHSDNSDNSVHTNSGVQDSDVERFNSDNNIDNTHTPTVVEQPTPVVVEKINTNP